MPHMMLKVVLLPTFGIPTIPALTLLLGRPRMTLGFSSCEHVQRARMTFQRASADQGSSGPNLLLLGSHLLADRVEGGVLLAEDEHRG